MLLRNFIQLPEMVLIVVNETSRFFLLTAISALGVRTSLAQIFSSGSRGFLVIGIETFLLLGMALLVTHYVFP
jgi:uncharacterized membrane protein YadS